MRITSVGFAAWLFPLIVANSFGDEILPLMAPLDGNELAGLAKGIKPELVTWERVYALAVVRARAGRWSLLQTLDPAALGRQADRLGVADFVRFRNEFFAGDAFRDPAPDMFALLGRLQTIENTRWYWYFLEGLEKTVREYAQHPTSGLNRLDLEVVHARLVKLRPRFDQQLRQFRDGLDELKVAIGLSPQAAIMLDREAISGFPDVFDSVTMWQRKKNRTPEELTRHFNRLPELGDVILDGQPVLQAIEANQDSLEAVLTKVARLAVEIRRDPAKAAADEHARAGLELQTRRRLRRLVDLRRAYIDVKDGYAPAVLTKDHAYERLLAPRSDGGLQRSLLLERLVEQAANVTAIEDQLVELWTTFGAERLALYREIGVMPYTDWKSYYADLIARRTGP